MFFVQYGENIASTCLMLYDDIMIIVCHGMIISNQTCVSMVMILQVDDDRAAWLLGLLISIMTSIIMMMLIRRSPSPADG